jgi:uncharacterized protein (TIGR03437 family)
MRSFLLFFTLPLAAAFAADPAFTTGQAARLMIGQPNFTAQIEGASENILGAVSGLAWAGDQLFVVDSNRIGATPLNERVLIYRNVPSSLPRLTDEFPVNDIRCQICVGGANVVLGQPDFGTVPKFFDDNGAAIARPATSQTNLRVPVAVASDGRVLAVADADNNRVLIWRTIPQTNATPPDIVLGQPNFTRTTPNDGGGTTPNNRAFRGPQGLWIQNGKLFVADSGNNRILIWNTIPTSNFAQASVVVGAPDFNVAVQPDLTKATLSPKANTMLTPVSVSSDGQRMFVADLGHNRVLIWNSIPTSNNQPADLVVGQADLNSALSNISVTTNSDGVFVPDNAYVKQMCGSNGTDDDGNPTYPQICNKTLDFPRFVLSDGKYLFIADGGNDRILVYNTLPTQNGAAADAVLGQISADINLISDSADPGGVAGSGAIRSPQALAFDGLNLYASDPFNRRVLIYTLSERRVNNTGVRNAASRDVFASNTITFSGTMKVGDEISFKIRTREYKYKVIDTDTIPDLATNFANLINADAGDPDVIAIVNRLFAAITLTSRKGGVEGNDVDFTIAFPTGSTMAASPLSGNLSGGNDAARIAPGTIVAILGEELAERTVSAPVNAPTLPRELGGVQVYFDGIRAPLLFVSPTEVRAQLPIEVNDAESANAVVRTVRADRSVRVTAAISVPIVGFNPGIFAIEGVTDPRPGIVTHSSSRATALLNIDGIVNGGDRATITIDGRPYTYIVQEGDTLTTIRDALILLINQDPVVEASIAGTFSRVRVRARIDGPAGNGIPVSASVSDAASLVLGFTNTQLCCANVEGALVTARNPALPGEQITVTATGLGLVKGELTRAAQQTGVAYTGPAGSDPVEFVSSLVGGRTANVVSAGLRQGGVGLYDVILELNSDQPTNPTTGATIAQGIYVSNVVTFPVFNPAPTTTTPTTAGSLTGSQTTTTGVQDLAALGTADWVHWGLTDGTTVTRKRDVELQISNFNAIGDTSTVRYTNSAVGFTWTGGTPTATATNTTTGVYRAGLGNGFNVVVPADTTTRTLRLFVGAFGAQGRLTAGLSDGSAANYTDITINSTTTAVNGVYTLTYKAGSAGQTLSVFFTQNNNGTNGNVTLQAAALSIAQ